MSNPRRTGLMFLLAGILILLGNTLNLLPPQAFWVGMLTYPIGGVLFFRGSRDAIELAEIRTARAVNPILANQPGTELADQQAQMVVNPHDPRVIRPSDILAQAAEIKTLLAPPAAPEIVLGESDVVTEAAPESADPPAKAREAVAAKLEDLERLQREGVISAEELAVGKAKLLGLV